MKSTNPLLETDSRHNPIKHHTAEKQYHMKVKRMKNSTSKIFIRVKSISLYNLNDIAQTKG